MLATGDKTGCGLQSVPFFFALIVNLETLAFAQTLRHFIHPVVRRARHRPCTLGCGGGMLNQIVATALLLLFAIGIGFAAGYATRSTVSRRRRERARDLREGFLSNEGAADDTSSPPMNQAKLS